MENDLKITEVEATRLSLQPGEVLVVKIYADDINEIHLKALKAQLKTLYPDNKIMLFALPIGCKIEMDVLDTQAPAAVASDCSQPNSYCNDCACGKKERIEGTKK